MPLSDMFVVRMLICVQQCLTNECLLVDSIIREAILLQARLILSPVVTSVAAHDSMSKPMTI
jgi:hypothetical protein